MNTNKLESLLRNAPQPAPSPELAQRLHEQVSAIHSSQSIRSGVSSGAPRHAGDPSRRRSWLGLGFLAGAVIAGAAMNAWQSTEIHSLESQLASLPSTPEAETPGVASIAKIDTGPVKSAESADELRGEISRLRSEVEQLRSLLAKRPPTSAAETDRAQATGALAISEEDLAALDAAYAKKNSIGCVNNLKNIGLAARIYATEHNGSFPPGFINMQSELSTPKLLRCLGDQDRQPAADWSTLGPGNISYEYLAPDGSEADPTRVLARCIVHGHVALCDGSVQMSTPNLRLLTRDGKLYIQ